MPRLGLCCLFRDEPIKFRTTTASSLSRLTRAEARLKLAGIAAKNAEALHQALRYCADHGIGSFRVNSRILPLKTHPAFRYGLEELPDGESVRRRFEAAGLFAREHGIRTGFHPDQFVVLNSARSEVVQNSIEELEYQAEVADWIGADVLNIHAGGAFGDKPLALETLRRNLKRLSSRVREKLTLENDDRTYAPSDLLPFCRAEAIPLVYDVHHHRCHPGDVASVEITTREALETWNREPLFHISSPIDGWRKPTIRRHHDYVNARDFPNAWRHMNITVEVEAKAKELAVARLKRQLGVANGRGAQGASRSPTTSARRRLARGDVP